MATRGGERSEKAMPHNDSDAQARLAGHAAILKAPEVVTQAIWAKFGRMQSVGKAMKAKQHTLRTSVVALRTALVLALLAFGGCPSDPGERGADGGEASETAAGSGGATGLLGINVWGMEGVSALSARAATFSGTPVTIELRGQSPTGLPLRFSIASAPTVGELSDLRASGDAAATVTYTPPADFVGETSFGFSASDGSQAASGTVTVRVHSEVWFELDRYAGDSPLTVVGRALTVEGDALPEGTYTWNWGDGEDGGAVTTHGQRQHTFSGAGTYLVSLTLTLAGVGPVACNHTPAKTSTHAQVMVGADVVLLAGQLTSEEDGSPLSGVRVVRGDGLGQSISDPQGRFSVAVPKGWSGTLRPEDPGYTFSPEELAYTAVTAGADGQNFKGKPVRLSISGKVLDAGGLPVGGVLIGGLPGEPVTDNEGNYTATVNRGYSGAATPSKSGYTFTPSSRSYLKLTASKSGENYTAVASGATPKPGVLTVTPGSGLSSAGKAGGPFTPASVQYTLQNTGESPLNWSASKSQGWVSLSKQSGTLAAGASEAVEVSINSNAATLPAGNYSDAVSFTNVTSGMLSAAPAVQLVVGPVSILVPGSGFGGPTPQPPKIGVGPGENAMAIACWTSVPYQAFESTLNVGVLAFHRNGIERVEFSLDGGPWLPIFEMSENPATGVWEYWCQVNAEQLSDGAREVRAIAYPVLGVPRVLDPLVLYANANGTCDGGTLHVDTNIGDDVGGDGSSGKPYKTISKALYRCWLNAETYNGGRIVLVSAGEYPLDDPGQSVNNSRYITIEPSEGLSKVDITIRPPTRKLQRPHAALLKFRDLTFDFSLIAQIYKEDGAHHWYDDCVWLQSEGWSAIYAGQTYPVRNAAGGLYVTNCEANEMLYGFSGCNLVRNCSCYRIAGDSYANSKCVVNCVADTLADATGTGFHNDTHQYFGQYENVIVCNVVNMNLSSNGVQNFFLDHFSNPYPSSYKDMAFVNIAFENVQESPTVPLAQFYGVQNHVLMMNVGMPNQRILLRPGHPNSPYSATDCMFLNCILNSIANDSSSSLPTGVSVESCHFEDAGDMRGNNATSGPVTFTELGKPKFSWAGSGYAACVGSGKVVPGYSNLIWKNTAASPPSRGAVPWKP